MKIQNTRDRLKKQAVNKKNKTFVIDLDGTICDLDSVFFKTAYALSYFGKEIDETFFDTRQFITLADNGILSEEDEDRILTLLDVFKIWEALEPFSGVSDFLHSISSGGHSIVYLTGRKNYLRKQTTNWLHINKFPRPSDESFGNETIGGKVTLLMDGRNTKVEHLKNISKTLTLSSIFYFENDPFFVQKAHEFGYRNIYTFKESYILSESLPKSVVILEKPKKGAYSRLDKSIFE